jgi:hypothetical protein
MRDLLHLLYADFDTATAVRLLRDPDERERISGSNLRVLELRREQVETEDSEFDNLLVALLSLRAKFTQAEALDRVELNIAMREGRR